MPRRHSGQAPAAGRNRSTGRASRSRPADLFGPDIAQGDAAVEHWCGCAVIAAIGDKVADALELQRLLGQRLRGCRFDPGTDHAPRIGIEIIARSEAHTSELQSLMPI